MTTRLARHASKKAPTPGCINSKLCFFNQYFEADFDQTTNYSLLYAEENSVIEEVGHFEYLALSSEQENTVTTYYTEGTPFETPQFFSTSTSTSDLLKLDDTKVTYTIQEESEEYFAVDPAATETIEEELGSKPGRSKSYMEFENKDKEADNSSIDVYLPDDAEDSDEKCDDDERLEGIINVTPSQSPVEPCDKDREGKMVTFGGEDHYSQQTPLMFSRCSSLGSLSGYEQQSIHDDRSSVVSDFSRRTSEVVSPSELPDSPACPLAPSTSSSQQRDKKLVRKKVQQLRDKVQSCESQDTPAKLSIFEDDLAVFKEESTPIKFQSVAASSLSSLTIDDEDEADERAELKNKAGVIKTLKTSDRFNHTDEEEKKTSGETTFEESSYFSVDEEQILDEYIRKGIAKVTRQRISDVSSLAYDPGESDAREDACETGGSSELFDENSDLTAEEEQLLDECIRRGIAKVTGQNINDVTSLSLRSSYSGLPKLSGCEKDGGEQDKEQESLEEPQKRTAVCQTE